MVVPVHNPLIAALKLTELPLPFLLLIKNLPYVSYLSLHFQAVPFFLGAIIFEYILSFLTDFPRARLRLNDAFSSVSAGIFSQLSK